MPHHRNKHLHPHICKFRRPMSGFADFFLSPPPAAERHFSPIKNHQHGSKTHPECSKSISHVVQYILQGVRYILQDVKYILHALQHTFEALRRRINGTPNTLRGSCFKKDAAGPHSCTSHSPSSTAPKAEIALNLSPYCIFQVKVCNFHPLNP